MLPEPGPRTVGSAPPVPPAARPDRRPGGGTRWPASIPRLAAVALRRGSAVVLFLAVWELVPRFGLVDRVFLPPFSEVVAALWGLVVDGELAEHLQASLLRSVSGLVLAVLAAIPLGLLIGWYRSVSDVLGPLLELFRNTSALALLPVFVLLLGLGETSKIALVVFACTWPILLNTISAVRGVDPLLIKSARSFGLSLDPPCDVEVR